MTTTTVERDEAIERASAEGSRLQAAHEQAQADLTAAASRVAEAESAYFELLVSDEGANPSARSKSWKQVDAARLAHQSAYDRVRAINEKGMEAEEERSRLITARMRDEQEAQRRQIFEEEAWINLAFIKKLRQAYAMLAPGSSVDVIFGGRDLIEYVGHFFGLQQRAEPLGIKLVPYSIGVVRALWQRGQLEPSYPSDGPFTPFSV